MFRQTTEIMANARKTSTQTVYDARLRIYDSWCKEHNISSSSSTIPEVAEFFLYLSSVRKCKPQIITGYKSAIALTHKNGIEHQTVLNYLSAKTQELNRLWEPLFIPSFDSYATDSEDLKLCPCCASNRLFVTYQKNHHKEASKDSIARLIVNTVRYPYDNADEETLKTVRAHDTRRLSTSWPLFLWCIRCRYLKAAHRTSESTLTSSFLKDVPDHQSYFVISAILDSFKRGRYKLVNIIILIPF
ncbi:unnamed protein product [Mytilus coruscus]|uniref:Core-binding (CB) domain-containing protein n=1 Tax=Mytilus coruscus TaxID=42192 RepID=A0A6J8BTY2_MYTCO|nr:unnamed protein product [Mytilus coruscus]